MSAVIELIHREAWPHQHHFSLSSGELQELFILAENTGTVTLYVRPLFTIVQPDGTTIQVIPLSQISTFAPGLEAASGVIFHPTMLGTHQVTAEALFGTDPSVVNQASNTKFFKFDVVP